MVEITPIPALPGPEDISFLVSSIPDLEFYAVAMIVIIFAAIGGLIGYMYRFAQSNENNLSEWFKVAYSVVTGVSTAFIVVAVVFGEPYFVLPMVALGAGLVGRVSFQKVMETFQTLVFGVLDRLAGK